MLDKAYPCSYRLSLALPGGRHSLGLARKGSRWWLLDPNVGVLEYGRGDALREDLLELLRRPSERGGYGAVSLTALLVEPRPPAAAADDDALEALLRELRSG